MNIPFADFNPRQFTTQATIPANIYAKFCSPAEDLLDFLRHAGSLMDTNLDSVVLAISQQADARLGTETTPDQIGEMKEVLSWHNHEKFVAELILARLSENYLIYLTDLASHIFRSNPNTMKSSNVETYEFILNHSSFRELIGSLADKRIEKLSSFPLLQEQFTKAFGLPLYVSETDEAMANAIVAVRNVIVHHQGVVSDRLVEKFPSIMQLDCVATDSDITFIKLELSHVVEFGHFLAKSVAEIDTRASDKFILQTYLMSGIQPSEASDSAERDLNVNESC